MVTSRYLQWVPTSGDCGCLFSRLPRVSRRAHASTRRLPAAARHPSAPRATPTQNPAPAARLGRRPNNETTPPSPARPRTARRSSTCTAGRQACRCRTDRPHTRRTARPQPSASGCRGRDGGSHQTLCLLPGHGFPLSPMWRTGSQRWRSPSKPSGLSGTRLPHERQNPLTLT